MTITEEQLEELLTSPQEAARIADLIYVSDKHLTIKRLRNKKGFKYMHNGKPLTAKKVKFRIEKLAIPPAWEDVLIAEPPNGHLQAVGRDDKDRKVYLYHETWSKLRNETKFFKMAAFANILPQLRKQVDKDLKGKMMTQRKVLALVIRLMEETHIRVGNACYAKRNKTYGLSTLRSKHVKHDTPEEVRFEFVGKKGKEHKISLEDDKLIELVNQCEEIPGWELFKYYDPNGDKHAIDSTMINEYIHDISGDLFSAKDFRTWGATKIFFESLREMDYPSEEKQIKKNLITAYDHAAQALGNTRSVVRSYYVHPHIVASYENGSILPYFEKADAIEVKKSDRISQTEKVITEMLAEYKLEV